MTINAAPDPQREAYYDSFPSEGTPEYREMHGDYIETLAHYVGPHFLPGDDKMRHGLHLGQFGGFTRYRGEFDLSEYGLCVLDRLGVDQRDLYPAHFMTH